MAKKKDSVQPPEEKTETVKPVNQVKESPSEEIIKHLTHSTEVMKAIRSQFGYSGYSNPNYINLDKKIKENEEFIESLK